MADPQSFARVAITGTSASAREGTDFLVTLTRTGDTSLTSTVGYTVTGGSSGDVFSRATGADFATYDPNLNQYGTFPAGTVTFAPGETSKVVALPLAIDTELEGSQTFLFSLGNPSLGTVVADAFSSVGTITDAPSVAPAKVSILGPVSRPEGDAGSTPFLFQVVRTGNTATQVDGTYFVHLGDGNSADAVDFAGGQFPRGTYSLAPGQTSATIAIDVAGDTTREYDESFKVRLSSLTANAAFSSGSTLEATGTILNDDPIQPARVSAVLATSALAERTGSSFNPTSFVFDLTRTGDVTGSTTLTYAVTGSGDHPATPADFSSYFYSPFAGSPPSVYPSGTVIFAPGVSTAQISVFIEPDSVYEADEGFTLALRGPADGSVIVAPVPVATILNDDPYQPARLAIDGSFYPSLVERDAGFTNVTYTVTRTANLSGASTVDYAVTGTGAAPADAADFAGGVLPSGTLAFAAGETSKTITIAVAGDRTFELDEGFAVTLSNPSAQTVIDTASASSTILNDDTGRGVILVNASEDFYQGHAQFIVLADGRQVGGVQTVTASHAAGQHQGILVSDHYFGTPSTVAIKFVNDLYGSSPDQDRNLYVERVVVDGKTYMADAGVNTAGTSTFGEAGLLGSGPNDDLALTFDTRNALTLRVSQDAYQGDAQFVVLVDGQQVGGVQTATASHAAGQWQDITVKGGFSADPASVAVKFVNDLYGGSPGQDRNLWVDSLTVGGATYQAEAARNTNTAGYHTFTDAVLLGSGPADDFALTFDTSRSLTLRVSEDAYAGDAQFVVFVDGRQVGGVRTATASHAAGQSQDVTITGGFAANPSTVAVDFVNDLYGGSPSQDRNLYVDKVTLPNGAVYQGEAAYNTAGPNTPTEAVLAGAATSGDHGLTFLIHA